LHIPDGFINGATSAGAAVVAAGGLGASLKVSARRLLDKQIPMAGLTAAFIFALQMLNFPVAAGTSGHLLGGALAAILLGPTLGITAVAVVVIVQALLFADGGVSALGLNVLNMALVTAAVGWLVFRGVMRLLPKKTASVVVASMLAAWASVVASSMAFTLEYAIGGQGGVDIGTVFGAMVGVHALIGIGEGLITAAVVSAVLAVRPDLVTAIGSYELRMEHAPAKRGAVTGFVVAGLVAAFVLVVFVAPNASPDPDGLERVAADTGFIATAEDHSINGPLADYGIAGIESETLGTIVAGIVGTVITFAVALILTGVVRRSRGKADTPTEPAHT
jgi:cobalt/nickel transport system permease protein